MNKLHLLNSFMIVWSLENKYMFYRKEENEEVVGSDISQCKLVH